MMHSGILLPPLLLTVGAAAILVGCTTANRRSVTEVQTAESGTALFSSDSAATADTAAVPSTPEALIDSCAVYPDAFSITYEVTDGQGRITTLRKVRDESGNVFLQDGGEQSLYLWDGHAYRLYVGDSDGSFTPSEDAVAYTEDYVEDAAEFFAEYAEQGNNRFIAGATEQGTQTYLDRNATLYAIGIGSNANGMTLTFLVDNETGLCLASQSKAQVSGFTVSADSDTLSCVEFTTEDIPDLRKWVS